MFPTVLISNSSPAKVDLVSFFFTRFEQFFSANVGYRIQGSLRYLEGLRPNLKGYVPMKPNNILEKTLQLQEQG
jgi:hypothetical protein